MANPFTQENIMSMLDSLYEQVKKGIPKVSPPVSTIVDDYLRKNKSVEDAARSLVKYQIAKCTTSGFLTGLGGVITLPVAIPVNISSVLYVQLRMIASLARMGGYDIESDQVQTLVYACLAGVGVNNILKQAIKEAGVKAAVKCVQKIPGNVLVKVNQKVGFRLFTKFGSKGVVNLGKAVPVVGGIISGGFDFTETKIIAHRAYKLFIQGNFDSPDFSDPEFDTVVRTDITSIK